MMEKIKVRIWFNDSTFQTTRLSIIKKKLESLGIKGAVSDKLKIMGLDYKRVSIL